MTLPHTVEKNDPGKRPDFYSSAYLHKMAKTITEDKKLWNEFRQELQKRQVVTGLATKEVLLEFVETRMKDTEGLTHSIDKDANHFKHDLLTNNASKDHDAKKTEHKSFIAKLLHQNRLVSRRENPFSTSVNRAQEKSKSFPIFDSKNLKLGSKLGNGSQSVVYEVKSFSSASSDFLCNQRNEEWTQIYDSDRRSNPTHRNFK